MYDGSSAYLGTINLALASVYYHLLEKLVEAGFQIIYRNDTGVLADVSNVKLAWTNNEDVIVLKSDYKDTSFEVPLPIITVADNGGNVSAFELGNQHGAKARSYVIMIMAESATQRNRYTDFIENVFSERELIIKDYNSGVPTNLEDNSSIPIFGYGTTNAAFVSNHDDPFDENIMDRHVGVISFTLEILQAV